jgi:hypothetical protein
MKSYAFACPVVLLYMIRYIPAPPPQNWVPGFVFTFIKGNFTILIELAEEVFAVGIVPWIFLGACDSPNSLVSHKSTEPDRYSFFHPSGTSARAQRGLLSEELDLLELIQRQCALTGQARERQKAAVMKLLVTVTTWLLPTELEKSAGAGSLDLDG